MKQSDIIEKSDCFVSVVAIIQDNQMFLEDFLKDAQYNLDKHYSDYEIVLVDQCSDDQVVSNVKHLLREIPSVRFLALSQRVHIDVAFAAGIENAIGA